MAAPLSLLPPGWSRGDAPKLSSSRRTDCGAAALGRVDAPWGDQRARERGGTSWPLCGTAGFPSGRQETFTRRLLKPCSPAPSRWGKTPALRSRGSQDHHKCHETTLKAPLIYVQKEAPP